MSFKCGICGEMVPPGVKAGTMVTKIREVTYPPVRRKDGTIKFPKGWEIVEEKLACPGCRKNPAKPEMVGKENRV